MSKSNKQKGQKFETKVQKQINSGALWFSKGDLKTEDCVIECKITEKSSYRITTQLLQKLWEEAMDANKLPKLVIGIYTPEQKWKIVADIEKEI